jgi:hypothetical protein
MYHAAPQYDGARLYLAGTWRESNPAVICAPGVNDEAERIRKVGEHARWRDAQGWHNSTVMVGGQNVFCQYPPGRAGRGHLVFGPNGAMHVVYSGLRIYSATPPDYNDWSLTFNGPAYLNAFGEFQIDRTLRDRISVLYCEQSTRSTSPVWVRDFTLDT